MPKVGLKLRECVLIAFWNIQQIFPQMYVPQAQLDLHCFFTVFKSIKNIYFQLTKSQAN